jgi:cytochrome c-type biogenesis protein CcmH
LLLAGSASYAESRYKEALSYWELASAQVPPQSPDRQPLDAALSEVRTKLGLPDPAAQALAATAIRGRVSLSAEARQKFQPDDTVFVFATPLDARMPLAILRLKVRDLPHDFVLDDTLAMSPQARLSGASQVVVRARVSRSGQAQAQADDWGVEISGVKPGAQGLSLVIQKPLNP